MKTIQIEIPDGKKAEWVNGVLTLVDEKPIEFKFKVGDKVKSEGGQTYTITGQFAMDGEPWYGLTNGDGKAASAEKWLMLIPQNITEQIKTFDDAYQWCEENGEVNLVNHYDDWEIYNDTSKDLIAYLKLRIITCALNEGWEPTFDGEEQRWYICADEEDCGSPSICRSDGVITFTESSRLLFKSDTLAEYASVQFLDLYRDFCGIKEGGE